MVLLTEKLVYYHHREVTQTHLKKAGVVRVKGIYMCTTENFIKGNCWDTITGWVMSPPFPQTHILNS